MNGEAIPVEVRAARHAALGDPARLRIVDVLALSDASPGELAQLLKLPPNLLTHHLNALSAQGLIVRGPSEGDRRRSYVRLVPDALGELGPVARRSAHRMVFVCTANSARSQLAAALWRQRSEIPAVSAGTTPAAAIDRGAVAAADRHGLSFEGQRPRGLVDVRVADDFVVTVCDAAHEALGAASDLHWSIPDPVRVGTAEAFDAAFEAIARRVDDLSGRLVAA